jgi:hypothetical protein
MSATKTTTTAGGIEAVAGKLEAGCSVEFGIGLSAGPILRAGEPTGLYGVWNHHATGADRKPGALDLATANVTEAAARFVAIRATLTKKVN